MCREFEKGRLIKKIAQRNIKFFSFIISLPTVTKAFFYRTVAQ